MLVIFAHIPTLGCSCMFTVCLKTTSLQQQVSVKLHFGAAVSSLARPLLYL